MISSLIFFVYFLEGQKENILNGPKIFFDQLDLKKSPGHSEKITHEELTLRLEYLKRF